MPLAATGTSAINYKRSDQTDISQVCIRVSLIVRRTRGALFEQLNVILRIIVLRRVPSFRLHDRYRPMNRAGQADECAPAYVFLAGDDSSYMTGQVLHLNGGRGD